MGREAGRSDGVHRDTLRELGVRVLRAHRPKGAASADGYICLGLEVVKDAVDTLAGKDTLKKGRRALERDQRHSLAFLEERGGLFEEIVKAKGLEPSRARALIQERLGCTFEEIRERLGSQKARDADDGRTESIGERGRPGASEAQQVGRVPSGRAGGKRDRQVPSLRGESDGGPAEDQGVHCTAAAANEHRGAFPGA